MYVIYILDHASPSLHFIVTRFLVHVAYKWLSRNSPSLISLVLSSRREIWPWTQSGALHKKSYISCCSGSQEASSNASSGAPIIRKQYTKCLHDKNGLQQLSSHEQLFWNHSPASSYISTKYSSPVVPTTVKTKPSSVQSTSVQNMSWCLALRTRSFCHDASMPLPNAKDCVGEGRNNARCAAKLLRLVFVIRCFSTCQYSLRADTFADDLFILFVQIAFLGRHRDYYDYDADSDQRQQKF